MYLSFVCVRKWLYEPIRVFLMLCVVKLKSEYHFFGELYDLTISLRVVRRCREALDTEKVALRCKQSGHEFRAVVR